MREEKREEDVRVGTRALGWVHDASEGIRAHIVRAGDCQTEKERRQEISLVPLRRSSSINVAMRMERKDRLTLLHSIPSSDAILLSVLLMMTMLLLLLLLLLKHLAEGELS
jgi:hypothetical protein